MDRNQPQVQAVRSVSKDNLDSPTITPVPTVYFDCHPNPATGKSFVLWDDIRVVFADALYVCHEAKMVPFMKDAEWVTLKPLRITAIPDVVLDVVVDRPLVRLRAAMQQTTLAETPKEATGQETPQETPQDTPHADTTLELTASLVSSAPRRNPEYGLVETAMDNYSHIDHPNFRPKPRAPQFVPTTEQEMDANEATPNAPNINSEPVYDNAQSINNKPICTSQSHQSPQDHTATATIRDISPIVFKASLGDAKSQVELGDMYRTGDGVVHKYGLVGAADYSAAMDWYMMAANQGYAYAQYSIGNLYDTGRGVQQAYDKAMEWYLRAADQSLPAAQFNIGLMYLKGRGVSPDETIALDWLSKAVSRKDDDFWSQCVMGYMYAGGLGVPQCDSTAFGWFLKAARLGLPEVQYIVGGMYHDGVGIPQDYSKALSWFIKSESADPNYSGAQYEIGSMYLQGLGVPKDYSKAKEWFAKAANLGYKGAKIKLSEVQKLIDKDSKSKSSKLKFW